MSEGVRARPSSRLEISQQTMRATAYSIPLCLPYQTATKEAFQVDLAAMVSWPAVMSSPGGKSHRPVFLLGFCQPAKARPILEAVAQKGKLVSSVEGELPIEILRTQEYVSHVQDMGEHGGTALLWTFPGLFDVAPIPTRIDGDAIISFVSMPALSYLREDAQRRGGEWGEAIIPWRKSADPLVWDALTTMGEDLIGPLCAYWCMSIYAQVSTPLLTDPAFQTELVFTLIRSGYIQVATGLRQDLPQVTGVGAYGFSVPLFTRGPASKIEKVIAQVLRAYGTRT